MSAEEEVQEELAVEEEFAEEEAIEEPPKKKVATGPKFKKYSETSPAAAKKTAASSPAAPAAAKKTGAQIFAELKKIIPTVDEDDYKKHGVWQDEIMKLDAELLQRHLEEAGTERKETSLPKYQAPSKDVWEALSKPQGVQLNGVLATALARATAMAAQKPGLGAAAVRPTFSALTPRPAVGLAARLGAPSPTLRIPLVSSAGSGPGLQAGVKRTAVQAFGQASMVNGALRRPGLPQFGGARPIGSVTGLAQKLMIPVAGGKGYGKGTPALGNFRPVLRRP